MTTSYAKDCSILEQRLCALLNSNEPINNFLSSLLDKNPSIDNNTDYIKYYFSNITDNDFKRLIYISDFKAMIGLYNYHFKNNFNSWNFRPTIFDKIEDVSFEKLNLACEMLTVFTVNKIQTQSLISKNDLERKSLFLLAMRICFDPLMFSYILKYNNINTVKEYCSTIFDKLISNNYFNNYNEPIKVTKDIFNSEINKILNSVVKSKPRLMSDLDDIVLKYNVVVRDIHKYSLYDIQKIIIPLEIRLIFDRDIEKKIEELWDDNPDLLTLYKDRLLDSQPESFLCRYIRSNFTNDIDLYNYFKKYYDRKIDFNDLKEHFDIYMLDDKILKAIKYWKPESFDSSYKYINYVNDIENDISDKDSLILLLSDSIKIEKVDDWLSGLEL